MSPHGAAAEEAAELEELRLRAAQRRQEAGDTLAALVSRVSQRPGARDWARHALERRARAVPAALARRPAVTAAVAGTAAAVAVLWLAARQLELGRGGLAAARPARALFLAGRDRLPAAGGRGRRSRRRRPPS